MNGSFVHLHIHSEYSLQDGLVRIEDLVAKIVTDKAPAVALTEQGNLFSALKFYRSAQKRGIKPIIGVDVWINFTTDYKLCSRLVLLCQDLQGYKNLNILISRSYREGQHHGIPYINKDWLQGHSAGLIALSGAQQGNIGQALLAGKYEHAKQLLHEWQTIFPDRFYLELQRAGHTSDKNYIDSALELALACDMPVVATNNVRFLLEKDFAAHNARVCIHQSSILTDLKRPILYTEKQYLRSSEEMIELFSDIPEAIENTIIIAKRCNLELKIGENHLPDFPVPEDFNQDQWLGKKVREDLGKFLILEDDQEIAEVQLIYQQRLESELRVIEDMGFSGYFLIVADFIQWAKGKKIPVGPGRGSGAGSLVAYVLGITEVDPLKYDLIFERFLNPERVSLPDFDIDFCVERRDEVIEYVASRYGRDRVSQIITYGSMSAKAVVRDVGRVLNYPYGFVDQIAKLIPMDIGITLEQALRGEDILKKRYEQEEEVRTLIDLAQQLEGIPRNASRHAGGIVISPEPLINYMPLYYEQGSDTPVTQFDMGDVEAIGLVKFDFLGLRTLTIIASAIENINRDRRRLGHSQININELSLDDTVAYELIQRNETTGIFQLESDGMRQLIKRLQPNNFDDLVALIALFRPGPLQSGMVDNYIACKHGREEIKYPHPLLKNVLVATNGVILYQEQVMQIAQVLAGYTLGAADLLRRAMGKKKPEEMAKQREIFIEGAITGGVDQKIAKQIFDLMEHFAGYGFNKSHSVTYALISYQTAWLKAHYPAHFMSAVLSSDMDNTDKIVMLIDEIKAMQIRLAPPSVNHSDYKFIVTEENTIRFGLGAIKGIGFAAITEIINARDRDGKFSDLFDLCNRVDLKKVNKRVFESLIRSGAADALGPSRSRIYASLKIAIQLAEQSNSNSNSGQDDFFGLSTKVKHEETGNTSIFIEVDEYSDEERLKGERETLGFYLRGHPITKYEAELEQIISLKLKDIKITDNILVAGYIHGMRTRSAKRGRMANLILDDKTGRVNVMVYAKVFREYSDILFKDQLVIIAGNILEDNFSADMLIVVAEKIYTLAQIRERACLRLNLHSGEDFGSKLNHLQQTLKPYCRGLSRVSVEYSNEQGQGRLLLSDDWKISIDDTLLQLLQDYFSKENVSLDYCGVKKAVLS